MKCDTDNFLLRVRRMFRRRMDKKLMGLFVVANMALRAAIELNKSDKTFFDYENIDWDKVRITGVARVNEYFGPRDARDIFLQYYHVNILFADQDAHCFCDFIKDEIKRIAGVSVSLGFDW